MRLSRLGYMCICSYAYMQIIICECFFLFFFLTLISYGKCFIHLCVIGFCHICGIKFLVNFFCVSFFSTVSMIIFSVGFFFLFEFYLVSGLFVMEMAISFNKIAADEEEKSNAKEEGT